VFLLVDKGIGLLTNRITQTLLLNNLKVGGHTGTSLGRGFSVVESLLPEAGLPGSEFLNLKPGAGAGARTGDTLASGTSS